MEVLAKPAFSNRHTDPGNANLYSELANQGVKVQEWSFSRILFGKYDIVHIHWPDNILKTKFWFVALAKLILLSFALVWIRHFRRRKVVWTAHNIESHEGRHPKIEKSFWAILSKHLDGVTVHEEGIADRLIALRPQLKSVKVEVIPLAHFKGQYPSGISREDARKQLGLKNDEFVFGFLGQIRPYKNVESLIRAFRELPDGNRLIVAGNTIDATIRESLVNLSTKNTRIDLRFGFVDDADLQVFYRAFDLVVLPFSQITNSGSALLALSFDCPVLIANSPTLQGMQAEFGEQYVSFFDGTLDEHSLKQAAMRTAGSKRNQFDLSRRDITTVAKKTFEFYNQVLEQ